MIRKHPDVIALIAIGFVFLASIGIEGTRGRIEREVFRVRPLILHGSSERAMPETVGGVFREILRDCLSSR